MRAAAARHMPSLARLLVRKELAQRLNRLRTSLPR